MKRSFSYSPSARPSRRARVVLYGLGAIGIEAARYIASCEEFEIVAAVDPAPGKAGRELGEMVGVKMKREVQVAPSLADAISGIKPDVAIHMAGSHVKQIRGQLEELIDSGLNIVSSAEELFFPRLQSPELADEIHRRALARGVSVVGVGVNPGFVMDLLPVAVSTVCRDIARIEVTRVVDASTRRGPLQRKIGAGLAPEEFERLAGEGKLGHVGLVESAAFIAEALRLPITAIEEDLRPAIANERIVTEHVAVEPGQVAGILHRASGMAKGRAIIELDLQMYLRAPRPRDEIRISARPPMHLTIEGGTPGDFATVAALVNAAPKVMEAEPGLLSLRQLALGR